MTDTNQALLIVVAVLLSIFIIICTMVAVAGYKLITTLKRVAEKAEETIDSVESAAEAFKEAQGKLVIFKLLNNLFKLVNKGNRK